MGAQLAAVVLLASAPADSAIPAAGGYTTGFLGAAGIALLALVTAAAIPARP